MKISRKEDYGLIFMGILARNYPYKYLSLTKIVGQEHLPLIFLKKITAKLLKRGIIESKEGVNGGYRLAKAPSKISVGEIIETISDKIITTSCNKSVCRFDKTTCLCFSLWNRLSEELSVKLKSVSLSDFFQQ